MNKINLAVLICTYNPNNYLIEQIESIKKNYCYMPIYLSDDSIGNSNLNYLKSKYPSIFEFCYIRKGPRQRNASSNFLNSLNDIEFDDNIEWVFLSDQDDIWFDNKVESYLSIINKLDSSKPQIIFSDSLLIDKNGKKIASSFFKYQGLSSSIMKTDDILLRNCVQGATLCINKKMIDLINQSLMYKDLDNIVMHDWWIAILAKYKGNWTFIDKPLLKYRQHNNNVVGASSKSVSFFKIILSPLVYINRLHILSLQYNLAITKLDVLDSKRELKLSFFSKVKLYLFSVFRNIYKFK